MECRKQKAREWQTRLTEEIKTNKNGVFVTLTFNNESIKKLTEYVLKYTEDEMKRIMKLQINEGTDKQINKIMLKREGYGLDNEIATAATRLFLERWRKEHKKSVKHWLVTELGHKGTENVHLHGIIWTDKGSNEIEKHWQYGWVWKGKKVNDQLINYVNDKTVNYITKYVTKVDVKHPNYSPIILCSKGIGNNYTNTYNYKKNKYNGKDTKETYTTRSGTQLPLPIYYRNKIYTEEEREQLWLQKLDQKIRWVNGIKIDISQNDDTYYKVLTEQTNKCKIK